MRPIKFRAWDGTGMNSWEWFTKNRKDVNWLESQKNWVVMQFTGLLDKNGKEIYEGDIVRDELLKEKPIHEVVFEKGIFRVKGVPNEVWLSAVPSSFEVLGNIYENPELLKS
jgi:uncharacterized phage protein (TIGR01671 family)